MIHRAMRLLRKYRNAFICVMVLQTRVTTRGECRWWTKNSLRNWTLSRNFHLAFVSWKI